MEKEAGIERDQIVRACFAGLIGIGALLLLTLLCAALGDRIPLIEGRERLIARILLLISSFLAGRLAVGKRREHTVALVLISGALLMAFLLILGTISENSSVLNISIFLDLLCIISGGFCACLARKGRRGKKRRRG